jgi:hypothetical protein
MPPTESSHRILGEAPHIGQRTFRASVSIEAANFMPVLLVRGRRPSLFNLEQPYSHAMIKTQTCQTAGFVKDDWRAATKKSLTKKKPPEGWPK